jgi:hypothetical protein
MMAMRGYMCAIAVGTVILGAVGAVTASGGPAARCAGTKLRAAGAAAFCILKLDAAAAGGATVDPAKVALS